MSSLAEGSDQIAGKARPPATSASPLKKKKRGKSGKSKEVKYRKAPQAPKRFQSPFILYTKERHKHIRKKLVEAEGGGDKTPNVAKLISKEWHNLPPDERAYWDEKARLDKERFEIEKSMYTGPWKIPAKKRSQKDPSAPKRPMSSFLSFSNAKRAELKLRNPGMTNTEASKVLAQMWKDAPEEEKREHIEREAQLRAVYKVQMAEWRERTKREAEEQRRKREEMALNVIASRGGLDGKMPPGEADPMQVWSDAASSYGEYGCKPPPASESVGDDKQKQHHDALEPQSDRQGHHIYPMGCPPPPTMYGQPPAYGPSHYQYQDPNLGQAPPWHSLQENWGQGPPWQGPPAGMGQEPPWQGPPASSWQETLWQSPLASSRQETLWQSPLASSGQGPSWQGAPPDGYYPGQPFGLYGYYPPPYGGRPPPYGWGPPPPTTYGSYHPAPLDQQEHLQPMPTMVMGGGRYPPSMMSIASHRSAPPHQYSYMLQRAPQHPPPAAASPPPTQQREEEGNDGMQLPPPKHPTRDFERHCGSSYNNVDTS